MATTPTELVVSDPEIMDGIPVFVGSRLPIGVVLASLDKGIDMSRVRDSWPFLTNAHIEAARSYDKAHPVRHRPLSIAEAHPDWKVIEKRVVRQPRLDLPLQISDLTAEVVARIVEESVGIATDEETTTLSGWCMYEARLSHTPDLLSRHLAGWAEEAHEGRVSSAVVELDVSRRTARTTSGRLYVLKGRPWLDSDARVVWARFVRNNGALDVRDVTDEVFPSMTGKLGMPEAADCKFEPPKAVIESQPVDLDDDVPGIPAADAIVSLQEKLDGEVLSDEELDQTLGDDRRITDNKDVSQSPNRFVDNDE